MGASVKNARFSWVTSGGAEGPRHPFDVDLLGLEGVAVTPTLGALVPGWLLVVPRCPAFCVAGLSPTERNQILKAVDAVKERLATGRERVFFFEHGARTVGSALGCGADQAHVHVTKLPFDLVTTVLNGYDDLDWKLLDNTDPWSGIDCDAEYFLVSDFNAAYVAYPQQVQSQFFRKVIAGQTARSDEWDYRVFEHERNARATIRLFGVE